MRHPCEPSEYQFHFGRCYLRNPRARVSELPGNNRETSQVVRYPVPNRDLDILFEVKQSRKPAEVLANVQYDKTTGTDDNKLFNPKGDT